MGALLTVTPFFRKRGPRPFVDIQVVYMGQGAHGRFDLADIYDFADRLYNKAKAIDSEHPEWWQS
ncbi:MAG TPA: hypothetical protein VG944_23285 [Fimbriimonas sp.]|nr:hypothetical protein [Fimbriimonas sp.]